jgi:hypothetical protein
MKLKLRKNKVYSVVVNLDHKDKISGNKIKAHNWKCSWF